MATTISQSQLSGGCLNPLGIGVRPDGSKLYFACRVGSNGTPSPFYMMDTATNTVTQTATFAWPQSNDLSTNAIAVNPGGTRVYLVRGYNGTTFGLSTVEVYDGTTGTNVASIPLPATAAPKAGVVSLDGATLYVVDTKLGTHVINTANNTLQLTMPKTQSRGSDIAINPDGGHIYTTLASSVFVLNTTTSAWESTVTGDFKGARQITVTPGHP